MRYAVVFSILATSLGLAATATAGGGMRAVAVVEAGTSVTMVALAVAFAAKGLGMPVEEIVRHPRWSIAARFLLLPYQALAMLTLSLGRRTGGEASMDRVGPGLFIGRLPSRSERSRLAGAGIDAVLDLCAEFPHRGGPGLVSAYVPILDGSPPSTRQFLAAMAWIDAMRAEGKTVLIHCAQGHGRSATVAAVALCRLGLAPEVDRAIDLIRSARPGARPSRAQRRAAARFLASADGAK